MNFFNITHAMASLKHRFSGHSIPVKGSSQRLRWPHEPVGKHNDQQGRCPMQNEKWKMTLRVLCASFAFFAAQNCVTSAHAGPTYPQWWIDQGVITTGQQPPAAPGEPGHDPATYDAWVAANFSPANAGQAKNLAAKAMATMEAAQAGSAGMTINNMVNGFSNTPETVLVPVNIGQVKALAQPFYDAFHAVEFPVTLADGTVVAIDTYPWNPATPVAQNFSAANIGQLKHVFSFDLTGWPPTGDADGDGLPDDWEALIIAAGLTDLNGDGVIDIIDVLPGDDFDGDGHSNLFEYTWGMDGTNGGTATAFADNFESYPSNVFDNSRGWLTSGNPTTSIDIADGANGTTKSLSLSPANPAEAFSLYNEFDNSLGDKVWIEFYIKSGNSNDEPQINLSDAASLRFTNSGQLQVFNGYKTSSTTIESGRWMEFAGTTVTLTNWNRITVRLDFSTLTWDLHLNGQFVAANLGFANAVPQFFKIAFNDTTAFHLDEVLVQGNTNGIALDDIDGDGIATYDPDPMEASEDVDNDGVFDTNDTETDFASYDTDSDRLGDKLESSIAAAKDFSDTGTYVRAPYSTGFEVLDDSSGSNYTIGALEGQNDWSVDPIAQSALITVKGSMAGNYSENAISILDDATVTDGDVLTIKRNIASYGSDKIWISFWGKLQGHNVPTTLTAAQQTREYLFMLDTADGFISYFDPSIGASGDWVTDAAFGDLEDSWHRYDIALNYQTRLWSISVDGVEVQADIPFIDPTRRSLETFVYEQYTDNTTRETLIDHLQVLKFRPLPLDADYDGMLDLWEIQKFGSRSEDADGDYDHDGRSNLAEYINDWDPTNADENTDDIPDGVTPVVASPNMHSVFPYYEDFESYSAPTLFPTGTGDWHMDGSALGAVQITTVNNGGKAMELISSTDQPGALVRYFDSANADSMWVDFYHQPILVDRPDTLTPSADNPTSFYFDASGVLNYYDWDSAAWFSVGNDPVTAGTWDRITIHLNFVTQEWSLYLNGTRILFDVDFSSPAPWFYSFVYEVYGTGSVYLDDVTVSPTVDETLLDADGDGLDYATEIIAGTNPLDWDTDGDFISDKIEYDEKVALIANADPLDATKTGTYAPVPVAYDFNPPTYTTGNLNTKEYWIATDSTVVAGTAHAADYDISLNYTTAAPANIASIVRKLAPSQLSNDLYVTFDGKLQPGQLFTPPVNAEQANTLFTLDANGRLAVYDYDSVTSTGSWIIDINGPSYANAWHTYQIHIDSRSDVWSLTVDGITRMAGIGLRDTSIPLPTYWSFHFQGLNPGDASQSVLIDNITIAHEQTWDNEPTPTLPFADNFDTYTSTGSLLAAKAGEWTFSGIGATSSIVSTDVFDGDNRAIELTAGTGETAALMHPIKTTFTGYLTVEFALKPVRLASNAEPAVDTDALFDFYVDHTGALHVSNGSSWVEVPSDVIFDETEWYQLRFALDFENDTYRVDVDRRFAINGLSFASAIAEYSAFRLVHRSATALLIHAVTVTEGIPGTIVFDGIAENGQPLSGQQAFRINEPVDAWATAADLDDPNISGAAATLWDANEHEYGTDNFDSNRVYKIDATMLGTTYPSTAPLDFRVIFTDKDGFVTESEVIPVTLYTGADSDSDGLPDTWENDHFGDTTSQSGSTDFDQDGFTNLQEFLSGSDPTDYYNVGHATEIVPAVRIVSGNRQSGTTGVSFSDPLVLKVTDPNGDPLAYAPLHLDGLSFSLNGGLEVTDSMTGFADPLNVKTDASGQVSITIQP